MKSGSTFLMLFFSLYAMGQSVIRTDTSKRYHTAYPSTGTLTGMLKDGGQGEVSVTEPFMVTGRNDASQFRIITNMDFNCEPFEEMSEWDPKFKGDKKCTHVWAYADHGDINLNSGVQLAVYCPCGCTENEYQGRVCRVCLRDEYRVRTYGFKATEKQRSEFMLLREKQSKQ